MSAVKKAAFGLSVLFATMGTAQNADAQQFARNDNVATKPKTELAGTFAGNADKTSYQPGQSVQFHQNVKGFARGGIYEVVGNDRAGNVLVKQGDTIQPLPEQEAKKFSVYKTQELGVAKNDLIRITQNGFSNEKKRLSNGNLLQVKGFDERGNILAATGRNVVTIDKDYRNFTHGYYTTSPAAQGKSVNRVLVLQTTRTGKAASKEQFYVSASRGKFEISVHTDSKEHLLSSVQGTSTRLSATEMLAQAERREKVRGKIRGRGAPARKSPQSIREEINKTPNRQEPDNTRQLNR